VCDSYRREFQEFDTGEINEHGRTDH